MILRQILQKPHLFTFNNQVRHIRPVIKMSKDKFKIIIDVRQFKQEELCVKARPEFVMIEGKQERKTGDGFVIRQFCRKFKLPKGCSPTRVNSKLSADGILTITAKREICSQNLPCETRVVITAASKDGDQNVPLIKPKDPCDGCGTKSENKSGK